MKLFVLALKNPKVKKAPGIFPALTVMSAPAEVNSAASTG